MDTDHGRDGNPDHLRCDVSLGGIFETLESVQESRDHILTGSRRVISLCSRSIIMVHRRRPGEAASLLEEAASILESLRRKALPQTAHYLVVAEQEYVEARSLLGITRDGMIPSREDLGVMPDSYILGLLDVVGELKRLMLDQIRAGDPHAADRTFGVMEYLYLELYPSSMYDKVLKESRRKMDVCRIILEDARSVITEERRRRDLMRAMGFEPTNS